MRIIALYGSFALMFIMTFESQLNIKGRLADGTLEPKVRVQQTFSNIFKPAAYEAAMHAMRKHVACVDEELGLSQNCKQVSPQ